MGVSVTSLLEPKQPLDRWWGEHYPLFDTVIKELRQKLWDTLVATEGLAPSDYALLATAINYRLRMGYSEQYPGELGLLPIRQVVEPLSRCAPYLLATIPALGTSLPRLRRLVGEGTARVSEIRPWHWEDTLTNARPLSRGEERELAEYTLVLAGLWPFIRICRLADPEPFLNLLAVADSRGGDLQLGSLPAGGSRAFAEDMGRTVVEQLLGKWKLLAYLCDVAEPASLAELAAQVGSSPVNLLVDDLICQVDEWRDSYRAGILPAEAVACGPAFGAPDGWVTGGGDLVESQPGG